MATHSNLNFSRGKLTKLSELTISNGDTFLNCNFTQAVANTAILSGYTGITFEKCNLLNCYIPGDATKIDCLHIQKSMCPHLHPTWGLTAEVENCPHVVDSEDLVVDGVTIDTVYVREDTIL